MKCDHIHNSIQNIHSWHKNKTVNNESLYILYLKNAIEKIRPHLKRGCFTKYFANLCKKLFLKTMFIFCLKTFGAENAI